MIGLLDFTRRHVLIILLILLPILSLSAVFLAPYGNATIPNCSFNGFFETCGTVTGGSTLFGDVVEATSVFTVGSALLLALLVLTFFESVIPWVVATAWSEGRGLTGWAISEGILTSLGPWAGLEPTWGYWLITSCCWASLVAAIIRRDGVLAEREIAWESARRSAAAYARKAREAQQESRGRRVQDRREAEEPFRREGRERPNREDSPQGRSSSPPAPPRRETPRSVLDAAALLGVEVNDSVEVVESAYREWAKLLHPDVNRNLRAATRQMQRINHARDTILAHKRQ